MFRPHTLWNGVQRAKVYSLKRLVTSLTSLCCGFSKRQAATGTARQGKWCAFREPFYQIDDHQSRQWDVCAHTLKYNAKWKRIKWLVRTLKFTVSLDSTVRSVIKQWSRNGEHALVCFSFIFYVSRFVIHARDNSWYNIYEREGLFCFACCSYQFYSTEHLYSHVPNVFI